MPLPFIAVESFFDPDLAAKIWPESITANPVFLKQAAQRRELKERLDNVIDCLPRPDMSLEAAIGEGYVTEEQAAKMYESLSILLESDPDYRRIILYLPFEFLPKAPSRFRQAYMKVWERMLYVQDVRANFVDGDILETEQYAGTLPRVVKAAHLIPKLIESGFMEIKDALTLMEESGDQTLRDSIADALAIDAPRKIIHSANEGNITEGRRAWLKQLEKEKAIEALAKDISAAILGHRFTNWKSNDADTKEALSRTLRRLYHSGVVAKEQLAELNIVIPELAGPFSENLKFMKKEINGIERMVVSIESNHELSQFIYPIAMVFGSRLNGYGSQRSDIDIGIFVKPGTPFSDRKRLQRLLRKTFFHENIIGDEIKEFWLEEKGGSLSIHDFTEWDAGLGESHWTHVLFGAAWIGGQDIVRELCKKVLVPYLHDTDSRRIYIEDLEQATLQYRLMHKGYELFFPPCGNNGQGVFWDSGYRQLATKLFASRVFLPKIPAGEKSFFIQ